jgi:hypothetical protein
MTRLSFMHITALTATNLNPKYLSCAIHFVNFWLDQSPSDNNNYKPLVIVVAQEFPDELISIRDYCVVFNPPEGLSDVFVSQFVRALYAPLVRSDLVLTTDVDMFPLSLKMFSYVLSSSPEPLSTFHVCRDVLAKGQYAICYNLASPKVWSQVTGIVSIADVSNMLLSEFSKAYRQNNGYAEDHGAVGWFSDQEFLFNSVDRYEEEAQGRLLRFTDKETQHSRLDRAFTSFPSKWFLLPLVALDVMTDYHVHHPVERNQRYISAVYFTVRLKKALKNLFHRPS